MNSKVAAALRIAKAGAGVVEGLPEDAPVPRNWEEAQKLITAQRAAAYDASLVPLRAEEAGILNSPEYQAQRAEQMKAESFNPNRLASMRPVDVNPGAQFNIPEFKTPLARAHETERVVDLAREIENKNARGEFNQALKNTWPVQAAEDVWNAAKAPKQVMTGELDPNSELAIKRMFDLGGTLTFGSLPIAKVDPSKAGIFGGVGAETANKSLLKQAQEAHSLGLPEKDIWQGTGWWKAPDGNWKFEIPDQAMTLDPAMTKRTSFQPLENVIQHPQLFEAYPQLKDLRIKFEDLPDGTHGYHQPATEGSAGYIAINKNMTPEQQRSVITHEVQHRVQDIEGFAPGANPSQFNWPAPMRNRLADEEDALFQALQIQSIMNRRKLSFESAVKLLDDELNPKAIEYAQADPERVKNVLKMVQEVHSLAKGNGYEGYSRVMGEVEARNVEKRLGMLPEGPDDGIAAQFNKIREKMNLRNPPSSTMDVPADKQLRGPPEDVRGMSAAPAMSKKPEGPELTRRGFLKGLGATAGAAATGKLPELPAAPVAPAAPAAPLTYSPTWWEKLNASTRSLINRAEKLSERELFDSFWSLPRETQQQLIQELANERNLFGNARGQKTIKQLEELGFKIVDEDALFEAEMKRKAEEKRSQKPDTNTYGPLDPGNDADLFRHPSAGMFLSSSNPSVPVASAALQAANNRRLSIQPGRPSTNLPSEEGYIYHATNVERAQQIANEGMRNFKPHEFTDQSAWPDGRTEPRSYFSSKAGTTAYFAPEEGQGAVLRMKRPQDIRAERGTGDLYLNRAAKPDDLEILGEDGKYYPLKDFFSQSKPAMSVAPEPPPRNLSPIGLYSHGAESASLLPQAKGSPQQFKAMLERAGVKPDEMKGFEEAFAGQKSITREQAAEFFNERVPKVEETVLGGETATGQWRQNEILRITSDDAAWNRFVHDHLPEGFENLALLKDPSERIKVLDRRFSNEVDNYLSQASSGPTKFQQYQLPGSTNYREVLLRLPNETLDPKSAEFSNWLKERFKKTPDQLDEFRLNQAFEEFRSVKNNREPKFQSSHWDEPNVLAHLRMADRTGPNGEKILHLEEIQSDWAQRGRKKGFKQPATKEQIEKANQEQQAAEQAFKSHLQKMGLTEIEIGNAMARTREGSIPSWVLGDPRNEHLATDLIDAIRRGHEVKGTGKIAAAPYVTNTAQWTDLALKRALKEAVDGGYDQMIITPGQVQADRYDLSKSVRRLYMSDPVWFDENNVRGVINATGMNGEDLISKPFKDRRELEELVGKEAAEKIIDKPSRMEGRTHVLEGENLKVGGEGMKSFYDKIVPTRLKELLRKIDPSVKVGPANFGIKRSKIDKTAQQAMEEAKAEAGERWASMSDDERFALQMKKQNEPPTDNHSMLTIPITPKMREAIQRGLPAYAHGGSVKPSEAQIEAGNYKKEHVRRFGLEIAIENKKGSTRSGTGPDGKAWQVKMPADYGYIKRTEGADGDHVDVYLGPSDAEIVFVVNQVDLKNRKFDEHKVLLGFDTFKQAMKTYKAGFSDGRGSERAESAHAMTLDQFKKWLDKGDQNKMLTAAAMNAIKPFGPDAAQSAVKLARSMNGAK